MPSRISLTHRKVARNVALPIGVVIALAVFLASRQTVDALGSVPITGFTVLD